jgi:hypothetical protein
MLVIVVLIVATGKAKREHRDEAQYGDLIHIGLIALALRGGRVKADS